MINTVQCQSVLNGSHSERTVMLNTTHEREQERERQNKLLETGQLMAKCMCQVKVNLRFAAGDAHRGYIHAMELRNGP